MNLQLGKHFFVFALILIIALTMTQAQFGQVIKTIPAPNYPYGLTFDGTYLWVGTSSTGGGVISKIDPADGSVVGSIPVPDPTGSYTVKALAFDGQNLWVFEDLPSASHPDKFYKVDPTNGKEDYLHSSPRFYQKRCRSKPWAGIRRTRRSQ